MTVWGRVFAAMDDRFIAKSERDCFGALDMCELKLEMQA